MGYVFVSSTAQANKHRAGFRFYPGEPGKIRQGVGSLEGRDDPFGPGKEVEGFECLIVADRYIPSPTRVPEVRMFRADPGIIQPRRHGMGGCDLPIPILKKITQ